MDKDDPWLLPFLQVAVRADADAKATAVAEAKAEPTTNKAGSPVYYPPGHELFHETMHVSTGFILPVVMTFSLPSLSFALMTPQHA